MHLLRPVLLNNTFASERITSLPVSAPDDALGSDARPKNIKVDVLVAKGRCEVPAVSQEYHVDENTLNEFIGMFIGKEDVSDAIRNLSIRYEYTMMNRKWRSLRTVFNLCPNLNQIELRIIGAAESHVWVEGLIHALEEVDMLQSLKLEFVSKMGEPMSPVEFNHLSLLEACPQLVNLELKGISWPTSSDPTVSRFPSLGNHLTSLSLPFYSDLRSVQAVLEILSISHSTITNVVLDHWGTRNRTDTTLNDVIEMGYILDLPHLKLIDHSPSRIMLQNFSLFSNLLSQITSLEYYDSAKHSNSRGSLGFLREMTSLQELEFRPVKSDSLHSGHMMRRLGQLELNVMRMSSDLQKLTVNLEDYYSCPINQDSRHNTGPELGEHPLRQTCFEHGIEFSIIRKDERAVILILGDTE